MSYLDDIAALVKEALPAEVDIPDDADQLFVLYAVLVRALGQMTTARDVHDAWSAWMGARDPAHESLVPFEQLSHEVQAEDAPFVASIHAVASRIG